MRRKESAVIEVLARGVLWREGCVLLCHGDAAENTYLPGGHVEFNEPAETALVRELEEEAGVTVGVGRFLGAVEHTFLQDGVRHCEVNLVFEMSADGLGPPETVRSREKKISFRWADVSALAAERLEPAPLRRLLPLWLRTATRVPGWVSTYTDL